MPKAERNARPRHRSVAIANRHPRLRVDRPAVGRAIAVLDDAAGRFRGGCPPGELSLVLMTDPALARIHGDFLGDASPTDVITFPGRAAAGFAGEVCVSADAAAREAGAGVDAFAAELTLYLVHGWLHLAGYDDTTAPARRAMRRAESRALRLLRAAHALPALAFRR